MWRRVVVVARSDHHVGTAAEGKKQEGPRGEGAATQFETVLGDYKSYWYLRPESASDAEGEACPRHPQCVAWKKSKNSSPPYKPPKAKSEKWCPLLVFGHPLTKARNSRLLPHSRTSIVFAVLASCTTDFDFSTCRLKNRQR